jgi:Uncharacterized protein, putative amidase
MRRNQICIGAFCLMAMVRLLAGTQSSAQIRQLAEMGTEQIRKLDRARTVILLPGGILEEHGP